MAREKKGRENLLVCFETACFPFFFFPPLRVEILLQIEIFMENMIHLLSEFIFCSLRAEFFLEVELLSEKNDNGFFFVYSRARRCLIGVRVKDGGGEAEVSWTSVG